LALREALLPYLKGQDIQKAMSVRQIVGFLQVPVPLQANASGQKEVVVTNSSRTKLPPDTHHKLEQHLGDCPACLDYVKSYRADDRADAPATAFPDRPMPDSLKQKAPRSSSTEPGPEVT